MAFFKKTILAIRLGLPIMLPVTLIFPPSALAVAQPDRAQTQNPRLAKASSPYLRLHAGDMVKWHPWNDKAFALARRLNRPLLVSFGYTACHWCHVMQETHFNNAAIARTINDTFIPVLVDRERHPELDETYMLVTEALTRRSGWPNTVFMTPERKPFYGTAFIPAADFSQLLAAISNGWEMKNAALMGEAERLSQLLQRYLTRRESTRVLTAEVITGAANELVAQFDEFAGGMGTGPKFFQPTVLMFLLQQAEDNNNAAALSAVETTLQAIASGGIHDQLAGGLHRYAIDAAWRVPHFEKMLYDQATMTTAYVEAYRITGKKEYGRMAARIADYVLADLKAPEGGFYATRDADSEGQEGTFYVWSKEQLITALGTKDAAYAVEIFEQVPDGEMAGKIILNRDQLKNRSVPRAERILARLASVRKTRIKPRRDEKIVVSWNGLMISALARAGLILGAEKYSRAAIAAGQFLWDTLRDKDGNLLRSYFSGRAEVKAELVDYAFLARSYIHLYDLTGQKLWLTRATTLFQAMEKRFADKQAGDYYSSQGITGFGRLKSRQDSDIASGNGEAVDVLTSLARRSGGPALVRRSEKLIAALSGIAAKSPVSGASILMAADRFLRAQDGPVQYGGKGVVRAHALYSDQRRDLVVRFNVARGWHINAHKPLEDYLIATDLALVTDGKRQLIAATYPRPQIKRLGFSKTPLALLEGEFEITITPKAGSPAPYDLQLEIQACSDQLCLSRDVLNFRISPPLAIK